MRPKRTIGDDPSVVGPGSHFGRDAISQRAAREGVRSPTSPREVLGALLALDLDDLDAGPRPGGYVEPDIVVQPVVHIGLNVR